MRADSTTSRSPKRPIGPVSEFPAMPEFVHHSGLAAAKTEPKIVVLYTILVLMLNHNDHSNHTTACRAALGWLTWFRRYHLKTAPAPIAPYSKKGYKGGAMPKPNLRKQPFLGLDSIIISNLRGNPLLSIRCSTFSIPPYPTAMFSPDGRSGVLCIRKQLWPG